MDERDFLLIKNLVKNPRASLSALAKELEISVTAVSKRLRKLEDEGVITYKVAINIEKMKMFHGVMFVKYDENDRDQRLLKKLQKCPVVDTIYTLIGWEDYSHVLCLVSPDSSLLSNFMTSCPMAHAPEIQNTLALPITIDMKASAFIPLNFNTTSDEIECDFSCTEDCQRYKESCPGCPVQVFNCEESMI